MICASASWKTNAALSTSSSEAVGQIKCKEWDPANMELWEIKSASQKREARFQDLMGKYNTAKSQGMTHKIWVTVGAGNVRQSHMSANNQKVKIDEKFRVGSERLLLPADPSALFYLHIAATPTLCALPKPPIAAVTLDI